MAIHKLTPGFDVSNNNGHIDWSLAGRCGYEFGVTKVSEGTSFVDTYAKENWDGMKAHGMIRGAYHFARPSLNNGHDEANYFVAHLPPLESGDFIVLDLEDDDVPPKADLLAYTLDFMATVGTKTKVVPLLYSGNYYLEPHNCSKSAELASHGLWIAHYDHMSLPDVPKAWDFWALWQYTGSGIVPGIKGNVDLDLFNGPVSQLAKYGKQ